MKQSIPHQEFLQGLQAGTYSLYVNPRLAKALVVSGKMGNSERTAAFVWAAIKWGLVIGGIYVAFWLKSWGAAACFVGVYFLERAQQKSYNQAVTDRAQQDNVFYSVALGYNAIHIEKRE